MDAIRGETWRSRGDSLQAIIADVNRTRRGWQYLSAQRVLTQDSSGLRADIESSTTNPGNVSIHIFQPASDLSEVISEVQNERKPHVSSDLPLTQDGNHGGVLLRVGRPG